MINCKDYTIILFIILYNIINICAKLFHRTTRKKRLTTGITARSHRVHIFYALF